ncbi:hypothetical protein POKO110462_22805 [Pontibacter korlensis]|uniref:Uncharacterized protein n=1 Tax=Pontibacter korlensis TaxID=400092 RepID=A0A0E3UZ14_9BACT|nr:hypothetical protein [Pontibacter korlensis]AKD04936.1 hypothetical protein PKOR_19870 [Pontibacter korlensis]
MNKEEAYIILDALAEGCSPFTGELLENESILNERKIIRALQVDLDALNVRPIPNQQLSPKSATSVDVKTVMAVTGVMKAASLVPTVSKLTKYLLGSKQFKNSEITKHELYGSLRHEFTYTSLKPIIAQLAQDNHDISAALVVAPKVKPWDNVDYFEQPTFCTLSDKGINQLKEKITELGMQKHPPLLSDYIIQARTVYARAYEPWSAKEFEFLSKVLKYTNDLQLLSSCFQRGENSLRGVGKRLVQEGKVNEA